MPGVVVVNQPGVLLYDAAGHPVKTVQDGPSGTDYLVGVTSLLKQADGTFVPHVGTEEGFAGQTVYDLNGNPVNFGAAAVPSDPTLFKTDRARNGGSANLLVDGSVTPVVFTFDADPSKDLYVSDVTIIIVASSLVFGSEKFAGINALTNGVKIEVTADNGKTSTIGLIKQNEDFMFFSTSNGWDMFIANLDIIRACFTVGGSLTLKAGTSDNIKVTIQDDLDGNVAEYFECNVRAIKQE